MPSLLKRTVAVSLCSLVTGLLYSFPTQAIDDGYIKTIEADVAEFTTGEFHPPANSTWLGSGNAKSAQLKDSAGFASFLHEKSPGSFIFYKKLTPEYQERLYKDYLVTGDLDRVKEDIFKYLREMKK